MVVTTLRATPGALQHIPEAGHVHGAQLPRPIATSWAVLALLYPRRLAVALVVVLIATLAVLLGHAILVSCPVILLLDL